MRISNRNNIIELNSNDIQYIKWRNFDGHPDRLNPKGCLGNFTVVLTEEKAKEIEAIYEGKDMFAIKIRWKPNRDGDLEPTIKVSINWDGPSPDRRPRIAQRTEGTGRMVELNPETIGCLNSAELVGVQLLLNPSKGCGCYVVQGIFTITERDLFAQYEDDVPFETGNGNESEVY